MRTLLTALLFCLCTALYAQAPKPYHPEADAKAELKAALAQAQSEGKHVLLQIGGNWCPWCIKFHRFTQEDSAVAAVLQGQFVTLKVNYSKENKNEELLRELEFPQRFGFPVFVVLDAKGRRLHTQNSAYLEEDKGYSSKKVSEFLQAWSPKALDPSSYAK